MRKHFLAQCVVGRADPKVVQTTGSLKLDFKWLLLTDLSDETASLVVQSSPAYLFGSWRYTGCCATSLLCCRHSSSLSMVAEHEDSSVMLTLVLSSSPFFFLKHLSSDSIKLSRNPRFSWPTIRNFFVFLVHFHYFNLFLVVRARFIAISKLMQQESYEQCASVGNGILGFVFLLFSKNCRIFSTISR